MVTSQDVEEIVFMLSSSKAKSREEGVKLLYSWLDGERSTSFCHFIGSETTRLKPNEVPHSNTWPFLVSLLVQCVSSEVASSRRRLPKLIFAKTLRIAIQRADDAKLSGKSSILLPVVKTLFGHVCEVVSNVPSFQTEYAAILRHLLAIKDYRFHFRNRVYCNLVIFYLERIKSVLPLEVNSQKEETFRSILVLQSLLENPPGDFTAEVRECVVDGLVKIFSYLREENKISRKLIECVNTFLYKDGPNLGIKYLDIHDALWHFIRNVWTNTHDRNLKDALYSYAKILLNMARQTQDDCLVDQILDLVCKELNMSTSSDSCFFWGGSIKDEKFGGLRGLHCKLAEISALVFYRACSNSTKPYFNENFVEKEPIKILISEALIQGKSLWHSAFIYLVRKYYDLINNDFFCYWFEGISANIERIISDANLIHSYDGVLWTLRSLLELSVAFGLHDFPRDASSTSCLKFNDSWQRIWTCLIHGLPLFSKLTTLVDVALLLLGNIVRSDQTNTYVVLPDLWDDKLFQQEPSAAALYFIACYFSHKVYQDDIRDALRIRRHLLLASLSYLQHKESVTLNEHIVHILPAAIYSLAVSFCPIENNNANFLRSYTYADLADFSDIRTDGQLDNNCDLLDCSIDALTKITSDRQKVSVSTCAGLHLSDDFSDLLFNEMECYIVRVLDDNKSKRRSLSEVFLVCSLLCNFIFGSAVLRKEDNTTQFLSTCGEYVVALLDSAVNEMKNNRDYVQEAFLDCEGGSKTLLVALRSFVRSNLFSRTQLKILEGVYCNVVETMKKMNDALVRQYELCSISLDGLPPASVTQDVLPSECSSCPGHETKTIVDMDLDMNEDGQNLSLIGSAFQMGIATFDSVIERKNGIIHLISSMLVTLNSTSWDALFELMKKEVDNRVCEKILQCLCENPHTCTSLMINSLVKLMNEMVSNRVLDKLDCGNILFAMNQLLCTFSNNAFGNDKEFKASEQFDQILENLRRQIVRVAESGFLNWSGRCKLVECICNLIIVGPSIGQPLIANLLVLLQDCDYRVRIKLARKIGVLFQMWDGHETLFEDICSNLGLSIVIPLKGKLVTANEVLAAGMQPYTKMETAVVYLMHLSYYSEKIELEAVFMMCVISALDACHRELVRGALDELSRKLGYSSRFKYLEQLIAPLLFYWVACGVTLAALIEIRKLFLSEAEPRYFMQYCCQWILPALLVYSDESNLACISQTTCQSLGDLCREHFVSIFAICMSLHCSKKPGWDKGAYVLNRFILQLAAMSENERDDLIKKKMVSIISFIFSLASSVSEPPFPFFSRETIAQTSQMVVDGFLEINNLSPNVSIIDKINIFRPDRVFMFILEIHYQIEEAVNHRHKRQKLAGLEVLVGIIGRRISMPSTTNYVLNLAGQLIGFDALRNQCCNLIFCLTKDIQIGHQETLCVLGGHLQILVSKLVAGIISPTSIGESNSPQLALLSRLTVDSEPSFHNFVKELAPFPDLSIFDSIRDFHQQLCNAYSPREHLLNLVERSSYLPPKLLYWSVQALHKKWHLVESFSNESSNQKDSISNIWLHDFEELHAYWSLVRLCNFTDADGIKTLVSDFISKVKIGDPHSVVIRLPGDSLYNDLNKTVYTGVETSGTSEELLVSILRLLGKYLMDDSARIVHTASQALRGILSMPKGKKALLSLSSFQRPLVEIHSHDVDCASVEKILDGQEKRFRDKSIPLSDSSLWVTSNKTFETWICPLVYSLLGLSKDIILRLCLDISSLKAELAELLLPRLIVDLATRNDESSTLQHLISLQVEAHIFSESNNLTKSIHVFLSSLNELRTHCILESARATLQRLQTTKTSKASISGSMSAAAPSVKPKDQSAVSNKNIGLLSIWEKVYWLKVDYLAVAKSAVKCGLYFTAVMYIEYWCEERFGELTLGEPDFSHVEVLPDHIEILVSAITRTNEPDSLYGIIWSHKLSGQVVIYEHERNWTKALECYDLQIRSNSRMQNDRGSKLLALQPTFPKCLDSSTTPDANIIRKPFKGLIRSLQQMGCIHLLDTYCQGLNSRVDQFWQDSEFSELQYEGAWRMGNWDFFHPVKQVDSLSANDLGKPKNFHRDLHRCLKAFYVGDLYDFLKYLQSSKQELLSSIASASVESTEYIYSTVVKLKILHHLGIAWNFRWPAACRITDTCDERPRSLIDPQIPTDEHMSRLNADWNSTFNQVETHTGSMELLLQFRRVLLQTLGSVKCVARHLLVSSSFLRKGSRFSEAAAALHEFQFLCSRNDDTFSLLYWLGRLEEAKLLHAQGHLETASSIAEYICQNSQYVEASSDAHRLIGKWLAETRSSNSKTILEKYLKPALSLSEDQRTDENMDQKIKCHFHLAHYTDALFRSFEERLNSSEWRTALSLREHKKCELEALVRHMKKSRKEEKEDYSIKIRELQKQLAMDQEEEERLQDDRNNFLRLTLEGYKHSLLIGDKYDVIVVFRLVSLWFNFSSSEEVRKNMIETINEVQTYKFLPLVYQIASRLGSSNETSSTYSFQFALVSLLKKMAIDHPFHTIFQLLALANGDRIKDKQRSKNSFVVDVDKITSARHLVEELSSSNGAIISQMKKVVEVYIKLAEMETKREDVGRKVLLSRDIRSIRKLELVPVVTANIPIDRNCHYREGSFPYFNGLADSVVVMNGINAPKVVECIGSDGKKYRQLAKSGNDDLRQDAVMEQFFGLVNTFLHKTRDTNQRNLIVRTYKVVPLTPSAGVLEWVNGTLPLGDYLIGSGRNGGAHARYGPEDWTFTKCREHMFNEKDKRKAFQDVCKNFRPVLHHFFLEKFLQPADWFQKRLTYARSVASSSMVGYIVGLGDRHSMNILIDQATADVVHIDLGVAFEQGLMLKTPERVPFRLTRDIIDGMGITGVEGVYRRCCEETLSVMRTNKEALLTIVEVFIYDPLYKWALSPLKALQRQKETDDDVEASFEVLPDVYEGNKDAARALMRVRQKLDGYEDGELRSVRGQVQQLIQDAIDPERLCLMYPGWAAWL